MNSVKRKIILFLVLILIMSVVPSCALSEKNNAEQTVSFKVPIKVNVIQYLGENF